MAGYYQRKKDKKRHLKKTCERYQNSLKKEKKNSNIPVNDIEIFWKRKTKKGVNMDINSIKLHGDKKQRLVDRKVYFKNGKHGFTWSPHVTFLVLLSAA